MIGSGTGRRRAAWLAACRRAARHSPFRRRTGRRAAWLAVASAAAGAACAGDEIEPPALLDAESAVEHPRALAMAGIGGTTVLRLLVSAQGKVDSVEVARSSGHPGLDSAAVDGAGRMTFKPAVSGGQPVQAWADVPVRFALPPESSGATAAGRGGADRDSTPQQPSAPHAPGPTP